MIEIKIVENEIALFFFPFPSVLRTKMDILTLLRRNVKKCKNHLLFLGYLVCIIGVIFF
jgi:hypothetical protein